MKLQLTQLKNFVAVTSVSILLAACATAPTVSDGAIAARANLTRLQSDSNLASLAPVEIMDAEQAVATAELITDDRQLSAHRVVIADSKVNIARAWAQSRFYEEQREALNAEAENVRLAARTREADRAQRDARSARSAAESAQAAAARSLREAEDAQARTRTARDEANVARSDAASARSQAELARAATDEARAETAELERQITELNATTTDRGLVVTLGDIMFETGRYELRSGTTSNLDKLATFLTEYEDRSVRIEGHTDSTGSAESNLVLSRQRADSVADYLVSQGIDRNRLSSDGLGAERSVADNGTSTGRQQNRRVEVIIANPSPI